MSDLLIALEDEIKRLHAIVRELRRAWFARHLASHPPEREWEDEARESLRASQNDALRAKYDDQTEALLEGQNVPLTPVCWNDMEEQPS